MLTALKSAAAATVAQYPQYAGHFDGYVLVRIKRDFKTKMGAAFSKDEITIAKADGGKWRTVWSAKNQVDTAVKSQYVEEI